MSRLQHWIAPARWLTHAGAWGDRLREAPVPAGTDALARALEADPRRLVALLGEPGAGTSLRALALARRAPWARYPDPLLPPDQRAEQIAGAPPGALIVLDGPNQEEALAPLAALMARPLAPGVRVVVPCDPSLAQRLGYIAGDYRRGSVLVALVDGDARPPPAVPANVEPDGLLALALAPRWPAGALPGEDELVRSGVAARGPNAALISLLGERSRRVRLAAALASPRHLERIRALLARAPSATAAVLATLARSDGATAVDWSGLLADLGAAELPDPLALIGRGVPVPPPLVRAIAERARALVAGAVDDPTGAALEQVQASAARLLGDGDSERAALRSATGRTLPATHRARLLARLGGVARDLELTGAAVAAAREGDDPAALVRALTEHTHLLRQHRRQADALPLCEERIELEDRHGPTAAAAAARAAAAPIAVEAGAPERGLAMIAEAANIRRALGDAVGALFGLYTLARWHADAGDRQRTEEVIEEALALAEAIGDPRGVAYSNWMLGAVADNRGDAVTAAARYGASSRAYAELGPVPDRLLAALRRTAAAVAGTRSRIPAGEREAPLDLPLAPVEAEELVTLRRGPRG